MRRQGFANRERRKARVRKDKRMPRYQRKRLVINGRGDLVECDDSEFTVMLCCHGKTKGGAWIVSRDPDPDSRAPDQGGVFFLPCKLADRSEPVGGFERTDTRLQRRLVTVHEFSMPHYLAVEKRLAA